MKRIVFSVALLALAACGPSAEDYAGAYVGDQVTHTTIGDNTANSVETVLLSIRAVDEETLRLDDLECPLDFKVSEDKDTVYNLVPKTCERESTRTEHLLGKLTVSADNDSLLLETSGKSTTGSFISINSTFSTSFTGTKQP